MALAGRVSVFKRTWPWGSGDDDDKADPGKALIKAEPEPETAAAQLSLWAGFMAKKPKDAGDGN
jgi:hypothetical protein